MVGWLGWVSAADEMAELVTPSFAPSRAMTFLIAAALGVMLMTAFERILRRPPSSARRSAIISFGGQMALAALWPVALFAMRSPPTAFMVAVGLWTLTLVTTLRFAALDRLAGRLMVPCLLGASFAAVFDASVWRLN
jgi:tryptophan-rich sensory protein